MKRKTVSVIMAVLLVAGGVALVIKKQQELAALPKPQMALPAVQTATVASGVLEVTAHYLGSLEPFTKADLSSRISGNILSIAKHEGEAVHQGEVLVVIDDRELRQRSQAVRAEFLATQQKLAGAKSAFFTQKAIFDRDSALYQAGAISKEALERSQAAFDGARTAVEAYQESLEGLRMNTSAAQTQAGYARLAAPFNGVVTKRWSEPGDLAVPGKPILTVEDTSKYKVLAQVPQEELKNVRPGAVVYLRSGGQSLPASINRVYPALDKNMLASVEVLASAAPFNLPSSSTVGFDLVIARHEGQIVPENALVSTSGGSFIYLVKNEVVHIQQVRLLGTEAGQAVISGEIADGDTVAIGQENKLLTLMEGGKVKLVGGKP